MVASLLAITLLGNVAREVDRQPVGTFAGAGLLSIPIGYVLFGVDALRYRLLPRWNLSPLLAGSTILLSLALDWFGVRIFLQSQLQFAIKAACRVLLGMALMDSSPASQPTMAS